MKTIIILAILLVTSLSLFSIAISGEINSNNNHWTLDKSPYHVTGDIIVPIIIYNPDETTIPGTLTIDPGVVVLFDIGTSLTLYGTLTAIGTPSSLITFKYNGVFPDPDNDITWSGISIENTTTTSKLYYCDISQTKGIGALHISGTTTNTEIKYSNIHDNIYNGWSLLWEYGACAGAAGITCYNGASALISNNKIYNNQLFRRFGSILLGTASAISIYNTGTVDLIGNEVYENTGEIGSSISVETLTGVVQILNNKILNNIGEKGAGIDCCNNSLQTILIKNNVIKHNFASNGSGGGMFLEPGRIQVVNNEIAFNEALMNGGGVCIFSDGYQGVSLLNNKIHHNKAYQGGGIVTQSKYQGTGAVDIEDNAIYENTALDFAGGVYAWGLNPAYTYFLRNTIFLNLANSGGGIVVAGSSFPITNCDIINNKAIQSYPGLGVSIDISNHTQEAASFNAINSIFWGNNVNGDTSNQVMQKAMTNQDDLQSDLLNCCVENGLNGVLVEMGTIGGVPTPTINISNIISTDPKFVDLFSYNFGLSSASNPCNTSGLASVSTYIGIAPYVFSNSYSTFSRKLHRDWNWVSFPKLDRDPLTDVSFTLSQVFQPLGNTITDLKDEYNAANYIIESGWENPNNIMIQSSQGYKINMNTTNTITHRGKTLSNDIPNVLQPGVFNYIGYYRPDSMTPQEAFGDVFNDLIEIQTEYWAMARINTSEGWLISTTNSKAITINFGDMVSVKTGLAEPVSFLWQYADPRDPYTREEAESFAFTILPDYIPIFVQIPNAELPKEVGVFADGVCKGAAVVEGDTTQINAYLTTEDYGKEITFQFSYDSKSANQLCSNYSVIDNNNQHPQPWLIHNQNARFYVVDIDPKTKPEMPLPVQLRQNYPNPFNPETSISYYLPDESEVTLNIYNIKGQKIRSLYQGKTPAGNHKLQWNGKNEQGKSVANGIYLYRLQAGNISLQKKMTLLK